MKSCSRFANPSFASVKWIQPVKADPRRVGRLPDREDPTAVIDFQRRVDRDSLPGEANRHYAARAQEALDLILDPPGP